MSNPTAPRCASTDEIEEWRPAVLHQPQSIVDGLLHRVPLLLQQRQLSLEILRRVLDVAGDFDVNRLDVVDDAGDIGVQPVCIRVAGNREQAHRRKASREIHDFPLTSWWCFDPPNGVTLRRRRRLAAMRGQPSRSCCVAMGATDSSDYLPMALVARCYGATTAHLNDERPACGGIAAGVVAAGNVRMFSNVRTAGQPMLRPA